MGELFRLFFPIILSMMETMNKSAVLLVLGSCLSLQFGAAVATQIFPAAGPWAVTALRLLIAGGILILVSRPALRSWTRTQWSAVTLFGISLAGMNSFFYASIELIPLGTAVTLEFLGPLLLSAVLSRSLRDALAVSLALIGMALIGLDSLTGTPLDSRGVIFALVAGGFWMAYILASKRAGHVVSGQSGLAVAFIIGAILVIPFAGAGIGVTITDSHLLLLALATALLGSVIPYSFELVALRRLPAGVFGVLLSLEPVFAASIGWVFLHQSPSPLKWLAIALVVSASVVITLPARKANAERAALPSESSSDPYIHTSPSPA